MIGCARGAQSDRCSISTFRGGGRLAKGLSCEDVWWTGKFAGPLLRVDLACGETQEEHLRNLGLRRWYKFQETPCQLETFSDTDWAGCRRTRRSTTGGYTSHQNVVQNTSCCGTQFSGSRVRRNNGTHIDVQRPRHAYERSGTGRCERTPRHCGPKGTGQIEASGTPIICGSK